MQATQKAFQIVLSTLLTLLAVSLAAARDRILVPSTATGGFAESSACHAGMVAAISLRGPQTVEINAAGRVNLGNPSYAVPPNGIALGSRKNVGALIGAFVPLSRASATGFEPLSENLVAEGIPSTSLFLIGNGPYKFAAPAAGTLFLGINTGDVCGSSGSFSVSVIVPVKIAVYPGGSLTIHKAGGSVIPVAILSSATFDARKVNPASLNFTAGRLQMFGAADPSSCHAADANGDGLPDMVCTFRADTSLAEPSTTIGVLQGRTSDGMPIRGETAVNIIP